MEKTNIDERELRRAIREATTIWVWVHGRYDGTYLTITKKQAREIIDAGGGYAGRVDAGRLIIDAAWPF